MTVELGCPLREKVIVWEAAARFLAPPSPTCRFIARETWELKTTRGCQMDARTTKQESRREAIERVAKEAQDNATNPPPEKPAKLSPDAVKMEPKVFQQRSLEGFIDDSESHIGKLMDAIRFARGNEIEPLDIWWAGRRWVVVDGHHRLKAYRRLESDPKARMKSVRVPVRVFEGTLAQAIAKSVEGNSKDKLPMSKEEKSDAAWRMVCMDVMSKPEIATASSRSEATVARMRRTRREILDKIKKGEAEELRAEGLVDLSWEEAQRIERGEDLPVKDEEWVERQAAAWARAFGKHFKDKLRKSPEAFARAIEIYSHELPKLLIESPMWTEHREEVEADEAAEDEIASDF